MKIAIAGAGWYGCHLAMTIQNDVNEITIFEKNNEIFAEASGNNQFRLHQGLHYARSSLTRLQSRDGYLRFCERYPHLSGEVNNNLYIVPKLKSLIDFDTYFSIMFSSGISIEKLSLDNLNYLDKEKVQGLIRCNEKVLLNKKAKLFFEKNLNKVIRYNTRVIEYSQQDGKVFVNGEEFDYFIDATWGAIDSFKDVFYETTILLYYTANVSDFSAITLVDGDLWSIYPTDVPNQFTLSSVTHTPIGIFSSKELAYNSMSALSNIEIERKRMLMEEEVKEYFPNFEKCFTYNSPQLSIKTKHVGKTDDRHAVVFRNQKVFSICSGKVDNIFQASDYILGQITQDIQL